MDILTSRASSNTSSDRGLKSGWGFPVKVEDSGKVEILEGVKHVHSCVLHFADFDYLDLIGTPTFGGGVPSMVWSIIAPNKIQNKEDQMKFGLEIWEPRIKDIRVTISDNGEFDRNTLIELVEYSLTDIDVVDTVEIPISLDGVYNG